MDLQYTYLDEIDSTNSYIKRELVSGAIAQFPLVVVAKSQTAGRGRLSNRSFFSPEGGLYLSMAFLPSQIACSVGAVTLGAGVAVARAVQNLCGIDMTLKWVNDVLYAGKKVCGILCESTFCERTQSLVYIVGIGVNTSAGAVDGFMTEKVGALPDTDPRSLGDEIVRQLLAVYADKTEAFIDEYNAHLGICGKQVEIMRGGKRVLAVVRGASADGLHCVAQDGTAICVRTCDEIVTDVYAALRE